MLPNYSQLLSVTSSSVLQKNTLVPVLSVKQLHVLFDPKPDKEIKNNPKPDKESENNEKASIM